jgi:ribosomal protein L29
MNEYRVATDGEKAELEMNPDLCVLVGPGGFCCYLGEPEDRTWYRDARPAVDELNRLHEELDKLRAALLNVRVHAAHHPAANNVLLACLITHIAQIADDALKTKKEEKSEQVEG